jgi:hypothetical protein
MKVIYIKNLAGDVLKIYTPSTRSLYNDLLIDTSRPFRLFREDRELQLEDELQSGEVLSIFYLDREYLCIQFSQEPLLSEDGDLYDKIAAHIYDSSTEEEVFFEFYKKDEFFYREVDRVFPLTKEEFFSSVPYSLDKYTSMPFYKVYLPKFLLERWNSLVKSYEMWDELDRLGYLESDEEGSEDF